LLFVGWVDPPEADNITDGAQPNLPKIVLFAQAVISTLVIIFVHSVARSFCETIKLPKEMPKIAKCLKCLKLMYSIDFIKRKKLDM
jgi:hypothetical protein